MMVFNIFILALASLTPLLSSVNAVDTQKNVKSEGCVIQAIEFLPQDPKNVPHDFKHVEFECELDQIDAHGKEGIMLPLVLDETQEQDMISYMESGKLVPNLTELLFTSSVNEGVNMNNVQVQVQIDNDAVHIPRGTDISTFMGGVSRTRRGRRASVQGDRKILVVKVIDSTDKQVDFTTAQISDDIFGTNGDKTNARSQFDACSHGLLNFEPAATPAATKSSDGVITVNIDIPLDGSSRSTVRAAVASKAEAMGVSIPGEYDYVMYTLENCYGINCGWAAYAYVNSWLSVYKSGYHRYPAVVMHELGHNFGLAHSGEAATYDDHSCLMGNPLWCDECGKMCYNGAKNWQLGWYEEATDKVAFDPINGRESFRSEILVGIADYTNNPAQYPVVIRIDSGTTIDLFVSFNRATGLNGQNVEADNQVTIIEADNNGESYSQSWLRGKLSESDKWSRSNFGGTGKTLTVLVKKIDLNANPGFAIVDLCLGGDCKVSPSTPAPSPLPTKSSPSDPSSLHPSTNMSASPSVPPSTLSSTAPSASPSSPTSTQCIDDYSVKFFLKYRTNGRTPILKDCSWLEGARVKNKQNACSQTESHLDYEPANVVCPKICNSCPSKSPIDCNLHVIHMQELLDDNKIPYTKNEPAQEECSDDLLKKFFWKYKRNGWTPKLKDCNWLSFTTEANKQEACSQIASHGYYKPASEICPEQCGTCPGDCESNIIYLQKILDDNEIIYGN